MPLHPAIAALRAIEEELNSYILGRQEEIRGAVVAMVARSHVFLYGPPGTAKSFIVSEIARRVRGATLVHEQLHAFITRDDLFGPVRLSALRDRDTLERNVAARLPSADLAILDEIWKCPPSTLNTLLTLLNERTYRNGDDELRSPLLSAFVTSNELPPTDRSLDALYDRIALRYRVRPLESAADRKRAAAGSIALKRFEAEARRAAAEIGLGRGQAIAARVAELRSIEGENLSRAKEEAAKAASSAGLAPDQLAVELVRLEREAEARFAAGAAAVSAEAEAGAISHVGSGAYLVRPERWLIEVYGELFSDPERRAEFRANTGTLRPPAQPERRILIERMLAWADERGVALPYRAFIERADLDVAGRLALEVTVGAAVEEALTAIVDALPGIGGVATSMRRETELRLLVAAHAALEGRAEATVADLRILAHALWERPEQIDAVRAAVETESGDRDALLAAIRETVRLWTGEQPPAIAAAQANWIASRRHELNALREAAAVHPDDAEIAAAITEAEGAIEAARDRLVGDAAAPSK
jgi:MoxR-like ATPase